MEGVKVLMKKILVIGSTGFIGSNLVRKLKDYDVSVLVRKEKDFSKFGNVKKFLVKDLDKACKNIDIIVNCSGKLGESSLKELEEVNVGFVKRIVESCVKNRVKKLIHLSSVAAMGDVIDGDENYECKPSNDYEITKFKGEGIVKSFSNYVILRPSMVYGPGEIKNKYEMFKAIKGGYYFNFGNSKISFVYIDDLIKSIILSFNDKIKNEIFIITDGKESSFKEFSGLIAKALNVRKPLRIPLFLANLIAFNFKVLSLFGVKPLLSRDRIRTLTKKESYNIDKAKKILKYNPRVNLEEGVKKAVEWYRDNLF